MFHKLLLLILLLISIKPAFAYLDPGAGSAVFQIFIAGFAAAIFVIKTYWRQIKDWFSKWFSK